MRCDNTKSGFGVEKVDDVLQELNVPLVNKDNIEKKHLGIKARLAMNYIATITKL